MGESVVFGWWGKTEIHALPGRSTRMKESGRAEGARPQGREGSRLGETQQSVWRLVHTFVISWFWGGCFWCFGE